MIYEGKGQIAPSPVRILLNPREVRDVSAFARIISDKRKYTYENCLIGYLGEAGLAKYIQQKLNIPYLANFKELETDGDGGIDIDVFSCAVQIKTHRPGGRCLISVLDSKKRRLKPVGACDYFVFTEIENLQQGLISLLGHIGKNNLLEYGRFDKGFLEVDAIYLDPIDRLIRLFESLKLAPEIR